MIKMLVSNFDTKSITCEFKVAAFKSVVEIFLQQNFVDFIFYLTKNIKNQLGELDLINLYNNDTHFALYAKMVIALAFVLIEDKDNGLLSLSENVPDYMQPILDWFEDNYIGKMNRRNNGRRQLLFPHKM